MSDFYEVTEIRVDGVAITFKSARLEISSPIQEIHWFVHVTETDSMPKDQPNPNKIRQLDIVADEKIYGGPTTISEVARYGGEKQHLRDVVFRGEPDKLER